MELSKIAKTIFKKYPSLIEDIIIYGSYMKGKDNPKDIDILIIFKKKINKKIELEFKKCLNILNIDINSVSLNELKGENFIAKEGIYLEGFSLIEDKYKSDSLGFVTIALLKYNLNNIKGSERIRFYYALQGRNKRKGFLSSIGAKRFAENVIVCNYNVIEKLKPFFEQWDIEFIVIPTLIPKRLKHLLLF